jgi:hypothetical protein
MQYENLICSPLVSNSTPSTPEQIVPLRGGAYLDTGETCPSRSRDLLSAVCLNTIFLLIQL